MNRVRDLREDLKTIEAATEGEWVSEDCGGGDFYSIRTGSRLIAFHVPERGDVIFITVARTAWPEAIHRALAAEARVRELEAFLQSVVNAREGLSAMMVADEAEKLLRKGLKP